jgi:hypothetical protein
MEALTLLTNLDTVKSLLYLCIFGFLVILAPVGLVYALYIWSSPLEAYLTRDTFAFGRRGRVKELRLDEIASITGEHKRRRHSVVWIATITDVHGQKIRLVDSKRHSNWIANFDYPAILRDLLPRLHSATEIAPNIRTWAETGEIP